MSLPELYSNELWNFHPAQVGTIRRIVDLFSSSFAISADTIDQVIYDGSNRLTQVRVDGDYCFLDYPNATTINISFRGRIRTVTLDGSGRVIGMTTA